MPAISLIIPLYNAVRHLRGCLNSVKAQTFTDFEVLLINDGSTDGTVDMAEACCRGDNRFRLITQANGGVSAARNRGMAEARAPFVAFLDQDDMLHPQALEILYRMICRDGADVSAFKIRFVPDNFAGDPAPERFDAEEVVRDAVFSRAPMADFFRDRKGGPIYIWNKLYRREAIAGVTFPPGVQPAEDTVFTMKMLLTVKNMVSTDARLLYYRENDASVSKQGITEKYVRSHALAAEEMERFFAGLTNADESLRRHLAFYLTRFIFKSLVSQPLRKIFGPDRRQRVDAARDYAAAFYRSGALKPELLGRKKALACRLYFGRHDRLAKFLV